MELPGEEEEERRAAPRPGGISFGAGPPPVFSAATAGLLTAAGKK